LRSDTYCANLKERFEYRGEKLGVAQSALGKLAAAVSGPIGVGWDVETPHSPPPRPKTDEDEEGPPMSERERYDRIYALLVERYADVRKAYLVYDMISSYETLADGSLDEVRFPRFFSSLKFGGNRSCG
jgi:hypothetical protein